MERSLRGNSNLCPWKFSRREDEKIGLKTFNCPWPCIGARNSDMHPGLSDSKAQTVSRLYKLLSCDGFLSPFSIKDLTNSIITAVFLSVVAILAMQEKKRRHLFYVGGSLCLTAVIVCCIDAFVVTKMMRTNLKRFLGIEFESKLSPAKDAYPETGPDAPQRPA
ncbi:CKLF-like MARVEL transmembrane domain-containing protein 1 [Rhinopithecus roxellana]|uniref:CKLF-like MARVEL transmembrane domain-containing protein 1 n=1 Tax=Rhinopithecus roxellana TaxID=61622 RepID=UPI00123739AF|nr:CKLF-like MARVEL transmembrane domain-containing protein 1 [Rhinopithecus roxellana]